jgi:cytochrome P450
VDVFDPYSPEVQEDPYPRYRRLRDEQPVAHNPELDCWFLFRFDDVLTAVHDHQRFLSGHGISVAPGRETQPAPTLIAMDNPLHDDLRTAVSRKFSPRAIKELETVVVALAEDHVDAIVAAGSCELMHDVAIPLPMIVVGDLLGVRPEDRPQFREWADALVHQDPRREETMAPAKVAGAELGRYFAAVIADRRQAPRDDLVSDLIAAEVRGRPLELHEIVGFAFLLVVAGTETTTNFIGNAVLALSARPEQLASLRADPSRGANAVEEVLRYDGPVQGLARVTAVDVELSGTTIPAGSRVQLRYGSANRDEREFVDADRFDVGRPAGRHVAFGHGIHHCLGAALARLEGRIVLEQLVRRTTDWEVTGPVERWPSAEVRGPSRLPLAFRAV